MTVMKSEIDLTGKLLIAMPSMGDSRFETTVIYICAHSADAAMGLIINKPVDQLSLDQVLSQLDIDQGGGSTGQSVHFGGPVENGRGFVLHSADYHGDGATLEVDDEFAMTASREILADIAKGSGPMRQILALGYAGWGPGQLEDEILANGWLTCDADPAIVFDLDDTQKWQAALRSIGVEPLMLSGDAGHA